MSLNSIGQNFIHPNQSWTSGHTEAKQNPRITDVSNRSIPTTSTPNAISHPQGMGNFDVTDSSFLSGNFDFSLFGASGPSTPQQQSASKANEFVQNQLPPTAHPQNNGTYFSSLIPTTSSIAAKRQMQNLRFIFFENMVTDFSKSLQRICSDSANQFSQLKDRVALEFKDLLWNFAHAGRESDSKHMIQGRINNAVELSVAAIEILAFQKEGVVLSPQEKISEEIRIRSQMNDIELLLAAIGTPLEDLFSGNQPLNPPSLPSSSSSLTIPTYPLPSFEEPSMDPSSSSDPVTTSQAPFSEVRSMAPSSSSGLVPTYPPEFHQDPNNDFEPHAKRRETVSKRPQRQCAKDKVYSVPSDSESDQASALITSTSSNKSISKKRKRARDISSESEDSVHKEIAAASCSKPAVNKKKRAKPITESIDQGAGKSELSFHFANPPLELANLIKSINTLRDKIDSNLKPSQVTSYKTRLRKAIFRSIDLFMEEDSLVSVPDMIQLIKYAGSVYDKFSDKQLSWKRDGLKIQTFSEQLRDLGESLKNKEKFLSKIGLDEYEKLKGHFQKKQDS